MSYFSRYLRPFLFSAVFAGALTGCAVHARVYDAQYHDYHRWNNGEVVYYNQWVTETHHPHVEYRALRPEEQRQYWAWRHEHH
jgi:hypothetical protein